MLAVRRPGPDSYLRRKKNARRPERAPRRLWGKWRAEFGPGEGPFGCARGNNVRTWRPARWFNVTPRP
jgi:hypothetical protein